MSSKYIKQFLYRGLFTLMVIGLIALITGFILLKNKWKQNISQEEFDRNAWQMIASPDLPQRFYLIYSKIRDFDQNTTIYEHLLNQFIGSNFKSCPCLEANYPWELATINRISLAMELERVVTPRKCLDYYFATKAFDSYGIQWASKDFFQKEMAALSDREMVQLAIMADRSMGYNIRYHPELFEKRIRLILQDLNNE